MSALLWDYSVSHKLLEQLIKNNVKIFATREILDEFQEVLKRDFLYTDNEVNLLFGNVLQFITLVVPSIKIDVVKEDADDNKIIECAVESTADYILSYDKHLLNIGEYMGIKIVRPEEAIEFSFFT